jgi:RNA polymerase sigma factor (sigma-70 family)
MKIADQEREDVLLRQAAKGDEEAFTFLYRRHQAALYRFALRMTGNAWAAEEIVQDVFMTLMRDPRKYDATRGSLGGFLYGVARNRVMKHLERLPREVPLEEKNEDGTGSGIILQDAYPGDLGGKARAGRADSSGSAGVAGGVSRGGSALRTARTEL